MNSQQFRQFMEDQRNEILHYLEEHSNDLLQCSKLELEKEWIRSHAASFRVLWEKEHSSND